jgi:hypothetical protein
MCVYLNGVYHLKFMRIVFILDILYSNLECD